MDLSLISRQISDLKAGKGRTESVAAFHDAIATAQASK